MENDDSDFFGGKGKNRFGKPLDLELFKNFRGMEVSWINGPSKSDTQALIEGEACEGDTFRCPYCPEVYETREKRDWCQASHFQDTENISRPRSDRTRHRNKNIVDDWRENKGEA